MTAEKVTLKQTDMPKNKQTHQNKQHVPVLLNEVLHYLSPKAGESYLDLTAGYGGHAGAILERTGSLTTAVLVDRDQAAITALVEKFGPSTVELRRSDFLTASRELKAAGRQFDMIMADLGVSSPHLNMGSRGFSVRAAGPLDMRMDQSQELSAADIVNHFSEDELADILKRFGEEPKARQIASRIIAARPLTTTDQLAEVVAKAWPGRSRIHPATRTFQALRIAVNDELGQLENSLSLWFDLLKPGGRIAVISFHSLEDRLVKQAFQEAGGNRYDAELHLLTRKAVSATPEEIVFNPRARSARLRAAAKK